MDELLIDDKKFISSSRAAKITGYARDYVGQLCREGYLEARRVGRSWYVLESAIKDHRFGRPEIPAFTLERNVGPQSSAAPITHSDTPHYEPVEAREMPSINRLREEPKQETMPSASEPPPPDFHDAWQAWFDAFKPRNDPHTDAALDVEPEPIPIHQLPPEPYMPQNKAKIEQNIRIEPAERPAGEARTSFTAHTGFSVVFAAAILATIVISTIGVGVFDQQIASVKQANILTGIFIYKK